MEEMEAPKTTAASRYELLSTDRQHFIDRADKCAKLTLPMLFQKDTTASRNLRIKDPVQSIGTRGVNTMAAKMTVSLLPMQTPFFKINLDDIGLPPDMDEEFVKEVKEGIGTLERQTLKDIENSGDVTALNEALKHLIVVGNVCAYTGDSGMRLYDLNKYVVLRDPEGNVIEAVICEEVVPDSLPKEFLEKLSEEGVAKKTGTVEKTMRVYTHIRFKDGRVMWHQEVEGHIVSGTESDVPEDGNPWLFLRFIRVDGESYGRSYVEMYLGDLKSLEVLSKAVNDASTAAAKVIFFVKPNGTTKAKDIANAPNMAVRTGNAEDVTVLRLDKTADMQIAKMMIDEISRRVAYGFMLRADVMRDAERVTAEEVRIVARELDEANGGIYSILAKEFQLPYVKRRMFMLRKRINMPQLPDGVDIAIVTGFAALGRAGEGDKLMRFLEKAAMAAKASQALGGKVSFDTVLDRIAMAEGVDTKDLFIDPQQQAENDDQQMGRDLMKTVAPELIKQAGPAVMAAMEGQDPNATEEANPGDGTGSS